MELYDPFNIRCYNFSTAVLRFGEIDENETLLKSREIIKITFFLDILEKTGRNPVSRDCIVAFYKYRHLIYEANSL